MQPIKRGTARRLGLDRPSVTVLRLEFDVERLQRALAAFGLPSLLPWQASVAQQILRAGAVSSEENQP